MTRTPSCHLLDILAEVPDPRHKKGKRHPLVSILALIVIGLMSNHTMKMKKQKSSLRAERRIPPPSASSLFIYR